MHVEEPRGLVEFDGSLDQGEARGFCLGLHVRRNLFVMELGAEGLVLPHDRLHADEIDDALEVVLGADRQLDRNGARSQTNLDVVEAALERRACLVHLVAEDDARHAVLVALAPDRLGLRLDALVGVEHAHGSVEHTERALHLNGEVDVARRVDDVQAVVIAVALPVGRDRGRRDRDAALLLLLHVIGRGRTIVDLADLMNLAGVIENPLGRRRLARIDVGHDAEVAVGLEFILARHDTNSYQR